MRDEQARELLTAAGVFFEPDADDDPQDAQVLNLNDTLFWGTAWGEPVSDEELPALADLFWRYGYAGVLYWVSEKNNQLRAEFYDVNRQIAFVRNEERIRREHPSMNKRAYHRESYCIGDEPSALDAARDVSNRPGE